MLIDRVAAMAAIETKANADRLVSLADVRDALNSLEGIDPATFAPKWISVEERLPELIPCNAGTAYSDAVIVWTDNRKAMIAVWDEISFLCAADYWEAWDERITHWMPLPEPPKRG